MDKKKAKKIITKLARNPLVQQYVQAKFPKWLVTVIIAVLSAFGIAVGNDVTQEEVVSYVKEFGGSAVMETFQEEVEFTGAILDEVDEEVAEGSNDYKSSITLPSWNDVKNLDSYDRERNQIDGTCVFESIDINTIQALEMQGLDPTSNGIDTFIDIDHAYLQKTFQPKKDTGAVPIDEYRRYKNEGLPIRTTYQEVQGDRTPYSQRIKDEKPSAYNYRIKAPYTLIASGKGADNFFTAYEAELKKGNKPLFRISIKNYDNIAWYNETTPYIKSNTMKPRDTGHSMAGGAAFGIFEYKGEPTVYIHESTGSVDYHLARLSVLRLNMTSWELYSVDSKVEVITTPAATIGNVVIQLGDSGAAVKALQEYLIEQGHAIPAGATGYYGQQTANALAAWYKKNQVTMDGKIWNSAAWAVYNY